MSLWEYANPVKFLRLSERVLPTLWVLAISSTVVGLVWGFFFTPDDIRQGSTVKIIYIHVPAALMAINAWFMMLVASLYLADPATPRQRIGGQGRCARWRGYDFDRADHGGNLGATDVGHMVGLGPAAYFVPDPVPVLFRLHRAVGSD